jgi:hypothetical protein
VATRQPDDERATVLANGFEVIHAGIAAISEEQAVRQRRRLWQKLAFGLAVSDTEMTSSSPASAKATNAAAAEPRPAAPDARRPTPRPTPSRTAAKMSPMQRSLGFAAPLAALASAAGQQRYFDVLGRARHARSTPRRNLEHADLPAELPALAQKPASASLLGCWSLRAPGWPPSPGNHAPMTLVMRAQIWRDLIVVDGEM